MSDAVVIRWGVSPNIVSEVRRLSLYPFKSAGPKLDAEMTADPTTVFAGAFRNETAIGCVALLEETKYDCELRIRWLGVLESARGHGVGARLVQSTQEYADARHLCLWADVRIKAIPLYTRLGFQPVGSFFELPEIGVHRVMTWLPS